MKYYGWLAMWLLLYPGDVPAAQDTGTVETKIKTIMVDPNTQAPVVVLESVADQRLLPIWIDVAGMLRRSGCQLSPSSNET